MEKPREESQILDDLAILATSPGYAHAIAHIYHRDNAICFEGELKPEDMDKLFSKNRLIRTELTTLIGLMVKKPLNLSLQPDDIIKDYVERTDTLMDELHKAIGRPLYTGIHKTVHEDITSHNPWGGKGMREPIFYGSESAYAFQYRDLIPEKYDYDEDWFISKKGFSPTQARVIAKAMCDLMDEKGSVLLRESINKNPPKTWLPTFEFSITEIIEKSQFEYNIVKSFFDAFTLTSDNSNFREVGDFNEVSAFPLIPTNNGTVLLFSPYAIYESIYESPFFWMWDDKSYRQTAMAHRGAFTEQFSARRLSKVFGEKNVYTNVNLYRGKDIVGEIDALVIYADRLIIVQAKAKKLTIAARKGNDNQLKTDFAAAIQDSYDQGWGCANEIINGGCILESDSGAKIYLQSKIKEIFIFNVVSDHYPALALQASQYLAYKETNIIQPPFIMDVFLIDTLTEMLTTPLRLLHYVKLRVAAMGKIISGHELNILGYHLRQNQFPAEEYNLIMLEDSIAQDLDTAMMVRRDNQPGDDTPVGILTRLRGTYYEKLISGIENKADPAILELGFSLLSMSEDASMRVHEILKHIITKTQKDRQRHMSSIASTSHGITFSCNPADDFIAPTALRNICEIRKYKHRVQQWFGVSVSPSGNIQFGMTLDFPWKYSPDMETKVASYEQKSTAHTSVPNQQLIMKKRKTGRNVSCPCGSGKKYKKCCLK